MPAVMGFQGIDDGIGCEPVRRQPSGSHGEGRTQDEKDATDREKTQGNGQSWGASWSHLRES